MKKSYEFTVFYYMGYAIKVDGLAKVYSINPGKTPYLTLRERLLDAFQKSEVIREHASLKDVTFCAREGEIIGIIGPNGAGKSTLLKILSKITPPSAGRIEIRGRVGSLLEIGTGFHPELSGLENIYFNGSILGMSRKEMNEKLQSIAQFSGIGKFIDTPVKFYSSGMYVRLAFSIAAHVDLDVMLVDEVLAVGDVSFQQKSLAKLDEDRADRGRTILFVSHNLNAIKKICNRAIWLEEGMIVSVGEPQEVISEYLRKHSPLGGIADKPSLLKSLPADDILQITDFRLSQKGKETLDVVNTAPIDLEIEYSVKKDTIGLRIYFDIVDQTDEILIRTFHDQDLARPVTVKAGRYRSKAELPANLFSPATYGVCIRGSIHNARTCTGGGVRFALNVHDASEMNKAYPGDTIRSRIMPMVRWSNERI